MARASVKTLLPLDEFAKLIGVHPLHFNQVYVPDIADAVICDVPILQYSWQASARIGREDLAEAISLAEMNLTEQLGFTPLPDWVVNDEVAPGKSYNPLVNKSYFGLRHELVTAQASRGYIIAGGVEAKTLIQSGVGVTYHDDDGDGYKESAVIVVSSIGSIPATEIGVYYPGTNGDDAWEVRPLRDVQVGVDAVITVDRHQLVRPELLESFSPRGVDGMDDTSFLTTVDVYRHYNDVSRQVTHIWDTTSGYCGISCYACQHGSVDGCLGIRDSRLSVVSTSPAVWDATSGKYIYDYCSMCRAPDRLKLNYYAGWQDSSFKRIIARYAITFLQRPLCSCQPVEAAIKYWSADLAYQHSTPVESINYRMSTGMLDCPLGTSRGAVHAWNFISRYKLGYAVLNA